MINSLESPLHTDVAVTYRTRPTAGKVRKIVKQEKLSNMMLSPPRFKAPLKVSNQQIRPSHQQPHLSPSESLTKLPSIKKLMDQEPETRKKFSTTSQDPFRNNFCAEPKELFQPLQPTHWDSRPSIQTNPYVHPHSWPQVPTAHNPPQYSSMGHIQNHHQPMAHQHHQHPHPYAHVPEHAQRPHSLYSPISHPQGLYHVSSDQMPQNRLAPDHVTANCMVQDRSAANQHPHAMLDLMKSNSDPVLDHKRGGTRISIKDHSPSPPEQLPASEPVTPDEMQVMYDPVTKDPLPEIRSKSKTVLEGTHTFQISHGKVSKKSPKLYPQSKKWTQEEDDLIIYQKEFLEKSWKDIALLLDSKHSWQSIQMRYLRRHKSRSSLWRDEDVEQLLERIQDDFDNRVKRLALEMGPSFSAAKIAVKIKQLASASNNQLLGIYATQDSSELEGVADNNQELKVID